MTTIRSLGTQTVDFDTTSNAAWSDGFVFVGAGDAVVVADAGNVGNGGVSSVMTQPATPTGHYRITITAIVGPVTTLLVSDPNGTDLFRGNVGAPLSTAGMVFTVAQGSTPFAVGDGFTLAVLEEPIDLTGISFTMQLRKARGSALVYVATVALSASTEGSSPMLINGGDAGIVSLAIPRETMQALAPGSYDYDLIASADGTDERVFYGNVLHTQGVTAVAA